VPWDLKDIDSSVQNGIDNRVKFRYTLERKFLAKGYTNGCP